MYRNDQIVFNLSATYKAKPRLLARTAARFARPPALHENIITASMGGLLRP